MLTIDLELTISPESIRQYREIANKYLQEHNSTISVAVAGLDENGNKIFGIRLVSEDGEEWYDPKEDGSHSLLGWGDEKDAYAELEDKVLLQIGYTIYQKDLHQFHKCMGELAIEL